MAKKTENTTKPPKDFQLIKAIRGKQQGDIKGEASLYKANNVTRDKSVRKYISENIDKKTKKERSVISVDVYK